MLIKKLNSNDTFEILRTFVALFISIAISVVIIFLVSNEPLSALYNLFIGPLLSKRHFFNVIESAIPLIFTGCGLAIVFKSGNFSLIGDSALYIGAIVSTAIAIYVPLPPFIHPLTIIIIVTILGGAIGSIPAILKVKTTANELVTSLMFNFVFYYVGIFIVNNYLADREAGTFASLKFQSTASLGRMIPGTRLHYGFLIALAVAYGMYLLMYKTKLGYEIRITGSNSRFARISGINVNMTIIKAQVIGGAICALGGCVEQLGMYKRFNWQDTPTFVWDGVIVTILAKNNPKLIPFTAFFLAYIRIGADLMSRKSDVQNELVAIIQAIIILFVTAESFMSSIKYKNETKNALK